jgi:hypothetical protein
MIVLYETEDSFANNRETIIETTLWAKHERPEIEFMVVILPSGIKNWEDN